MQIRESRHTWDLLLPAGSRLTCSQSHRIRDWWGYLSGTENGIVAWTSKRTLLRSELESEGMCFASMFIRDHLWLMQQMNFSRWITTDHNIKWSSPLDPHLFIESRCYICTKENLLLHFCAGASQVSQQLFEVFQLMSRSTVCADWSKELAPNKSRTLNPSGYQNNLHTPANIMYSKRNNRTQYAMSYANEYDVVIIFV